LDNNKNTASAKGNVRLWLDEQYRLVGLSAKVDQSTIDAKFTDFQLVDEKHYVAFEKDIVLNSPESGEIRFKINFNKIDLNEEQDLKFEIPDHYEQIISGNKIPKKQD
jgi:lipopolysaccharide assembly outer membrane protein LptD (OstA)